MRAVGTWVCARHRYFECPTCLKLKDGGDRGRDWIDRELGDVPFRFVYQGVPIENNPSFDPDYTPTDAHTVGAPDWFDKPTGHPEYGGVRNL